MAKACLRSPLTAATRDMSTSMTVVQCAAVLRLRTMCSAIETPICGIVTSTSAVLSVGEELTAGGLQVFRLRQHVLLERRTERNRDVRGGEPNDRSVEMLERLLGD